MANRQALRDLQTRLAERLKQARSEGVAVSWLAVESAGVSLLLPLAQAGEIFPLGAVQAVPYTQAWFLGVANLRGGLFGVVDFASYISGQAPGRRLESARAQARLVALNPAIEVNCALLVDRLVGLRNAQDFESQVTREVEASDEGTSITPVYFADTFIDKQGKSWQEIDLQALASWAGFLSIGR
jgi:twitching motility protein PilI